MEYGTMELRTIKKTRSCVFLCVLRGWMEENAVRNYLRGKVQTEMKLKAEGLSSSAIEETKRISSFQLDDFTFVGLQICFMFVQR